MKRLFILLGIALCALCAYAQSWNSGINTLYTSPDTVKVGIGTSSPSERLHIDNGALKIGNGISPADRSKNLLKFGDGSYVQIGEWEADDMLSFKANRYNFTGGNVGIGVTLPTYKLDVNGKVFLHTYEWLPGGAYSYFHWQAHHLVMGVPAGEYAVTRLDLKSGGCNQGKLFSEFTMYTADSVNQHTAKIRFNTEETCWINSPGYIGIGTTTPQAKLDVRGRIRADEILVNLVSGADFVFDDTYYLRPLSELHQYIQENQHLPEIPSAEEMQENGVNMNALQIQLLQKVEELTLYIIHQEKRIQELESIISK